MGFAGLIDILAVDRAVRSCKIDEFKDAERPVIRGLGLDTLDAVFVDNHDFSGIKLAHKIGLNQVQGTGFRRQDVMAVELAKT